MYLGDGHARLLAQIAEGRDLGLGLEAGHEAARDAGDDLVCGGEGD